MSFELARKVEDWLADDDFQAAFGAVEQKIIREFWQANPKDIDELSRCRHMLGCVMELKSYFEDLVQTERFEELQRNREY